MSKNTNGKRMRVGPGFSDRDTDYDNELPGTDEENSSKFIELQNFQKAMYEEIKKLFIADEERQFHKRWTKKDKEDMKREARLDLEEDNRNALEAHKIKLKVEIREQLEKVKAALREEEAKTKMLEEELMKLKEECEKTHITVDTAVIAGILRPNVE